MKLDFVELDIDKLKTAPVHLSKLSNIVDKNVVQKIVYDKSVTKISAIDNCGVFLSTQYNNTSKVLKRKLLPVARDNRY